MYETGVVLNLDKQLVRAQIWRRYWRFMQYEAVILPMRHFAFRIHYNNVNNGHALINFGSLYVMGVVLALDK